jgi:hypothetical protein
VNLRAPSKFLGRLTSSSSILTEHEETMILFNVKFDFLGD